MKYIPIKYNTLDVKIGDSQLKFIGIDTNITFGNLKSTVERGRVNKQFTVQTDLNDSTVKSYTKIAHEQYAFKVENEKSATVLADTILLVITGRYSIVFFRRWFRSNSDLDYVVLTDVQPNGFFI